MSCGQFFDTTLGSDWLVIEPISVSCDLCEDPAIFPLIIDHLFWVTTSADGILRLCRDFFTEVIMMCHCLPTSCCAYRLYI